MKVNIFHFTDISHTGPTGKHPNTGKETEVRFVE